MHSHSRSLFGTGLAVAAAAAAEGAKVFIVSSNKFRVDAAVKTLLPGAEGFAVDVRDEEAVKSFFATIGTFDHLVVR